MLRSCASAASGPSRPSHSSHIAELHASSKDDNDGSSPSPMQILFAHKLESYRFEMFVVSCLIVDVWCVFVEIVASEGGLNEGVKWVESMVTFAVNCSRTIIVLFLLDTGLHIYAFGPKRYFSHKWYALDGFVVLVTAVVSMFPSFPSFPPFVPFPLPPLPSSFSLVSAFSVLSPPL